MRVFVLRLRHIRRLDFWIFLGLVYLIDASNTFFLESFFGSSILVFAAVCVGYPLLRDALLAISGVEIFVFFADSDLYGRVLCIHGAAKFFGCSILVFLGRLACVPAWPSISGISIFDILSGFTSS